MCGRFAFFSKGRALEEMFGVAFAPEPAPRYNIAPGQPVAVVRARPEGGGREAAVVRWGLVPPWAKDPAIGNRMINARAETAAEKPAFRAAFRRRRCLVPADGFYEWAKAGARKQPYFVRRRDGAPLAIAGLWERWEGPDGSVLETCTLLTTEANELLAPIHDRMPVLLPSEAFAAWLNSSGLPPADAAALLRPAPPEPMDAYPVSLKVNDPSRDAPELILPLSA